LRPAQEPPREQHAALRVKARVLLAMQREPRLPEQEPPLPSALLRGLAV
jgi:hypothetical protein